MGSVGKDIEKGVSGIGNAIGFGKPPSLGAGGKFAISAEAKSAEDEAIQQLRDKINGKTSTISELQYKQALDDLIKNQQSGAASVRGVSNVGLANRNVMQQSQQAQLDIGRESAAAKLAEMNQAQQLILNQANAQRGVAVSAANADAGLLQKQQEGFQKAISQLGAAAASGSGGGGGGGGGAAAASDENLKKDIKDGGSDASKVISEFMDALKSYTYEYKDKASNGRKNPEGEVTSVMAQDLEKTKVGKRAVKEGPDGKEVDYAQLMAPMLASMAELNKRLKKVEA